MTNNNEVLFEIPKEGEPWGVIVIGSGPAGLTSAVYTTRGALSTLVIEGENPGGQLMQTTEVDNFPGFPKGILGPDLMANMKSQALRFGANFVAEDVSGVNLLPKIKEITVKSGKKFFARSVIIATGAKTKWLDVPGEAKLRGRGISSCAPCDAPFFKNKTVVVVGGGDSAMEEALVLTKYASLVTIIHRRAEFKASKAMQDKVFETKKAGKIDIIYNSEITEFLGENKLEKIVVRDIVKNKTKEMPIDGVFVAIGHNPSTQFLKDIDLDEKSYVKKSTNGSFDSSTNIPGVFTAGDVHDRKYKQAITASAFGCMAGMDALSYLDEQK